MSGVPCTSRCWSASVELGSSGVGGSSLLGAGLPVGDWQFWVVTVIFLWALAWLLRGVLPIPIISKKYRRRRRGERKATLTISARARDDQEAE